MSTIKTTTLSTQGGSTVPVDTVVNGTAKAWVNFNGTGVVAIRRAFNVSSITDGGTGSYYVNLAESISDGNYSVISTTGYDSGGDTGHTSPNIRTQTTSSFRVVVFNDGNAVVDVDYVTAAVFS